MKEVTVTRFVEAMKPHYREYYTLGLTATQVSFLHGLIALASRHPEVKQMVGPCADFTGYINRWCCERFMDWGLTLEEIEYLNIPKEVQHAADKRTGPGQDPATQQRD